MPGAALSQSTKRVVIVGASHAGAGAALHLRRLGWEGNILIIGGEQHLPYQRPPLSKDYLKGNKAVEDFLVRPAAAYANADISLMLGSRVVAIDPEGRRVSTDEGDAFRYDKLLLATGAVPRRLNIPGADLEHVYYLRTVEDVDRIRLQAESGQRAVVIGGGYIGLETAASLRMMGLEVTVLEAMPRVLQRVSGEVISGFFERLHREHGIEVHTGAVVSALHGELSVSGVELEGGDTLAADLVVIGVGVIPSIELAEDAGLATGDGIEVDASARSSDPHIWAAGDCASIVHPRYPGRLRLESVQNANDGALVAAQSMLGNEVVYDALPWFWSEQFDVRLQIAGLTRDYDSVVVRGDPTAGSHFAVFYLKGEALVAVEAVNSPREFMFGKKVIAAGACVDIDRLPDTDIPITELVRNGP